MALLALLSVLAATTISRTQVNYDLTSYLAEDTDTQRGLKLMNGEFSPVSLMSVVLVDASEETAQARTAEIAALPGVLTALHDPAESTREQDGHTYRLISVTMEEDAEETLLDSVEALVQDIPHLTSGGAKENRTLQSSILREMPVVMAVSCAIVFVILLVMTRSWLEPIIFFLDIAVSILLNMGTNWIFPSISFITFAVTAILQLALAMDYSIMLMNAFDRLRGQAISTREAMVQALAEVFIPLSSSALTTVAGMLALVFMKFTIGFDIGIVLAKGILISMLTVFLFLPGVLVLAAPLLDKTAHKPLRLSGKGLSRLSGALHGALPMLLILLIVIAAALQGQNVYTFTIRSSDPETQQIADLFGTSNQLVLLYPLEESDEGIARQREMLEKVGEITVDGEPLVQETLSLATTGAAAYTYYDAASAAALLGRSESDVQRLFTLMNIPTPIRGDELLDRLAATMGRFAFLLPEGALEQVEGARDLLNTAKATFNGPHYTRALLKLNLSYTSPSLHSVMEQIKAILRTYYGEDTAMTGMLLAIDDIAVSFGQDMRRVSLITIVFVFLIVLCSFRSLAIPALLVCVIQGAIWINMSFSNRVDGSIFFMCYLICVALQMGATIDYGILLTSHYCAQRASLPPAEAAGKAIGLSLQTVLTSGSALVVAGFTVGIVSSVYYISSIGTMLARGAVVSVILVLLLLPWLLQKLDRWIRK